MAFETISSQNKDKFLARKERLVINDDERHIINFAYSGHMGIKELILGRSVTEIDNGAFYDCEKLENINLGKNKNFWFKEGCLIQKRTKRLSLCITRPHIPDIVKKVNMTCFLKREPISEFYIGAGLEEIDRASRKFNIENIVLSADNALFELRNGCLFKRGSGTLLLGCDSGTIAEGTETVDTWSFYGSRLKKIIIPASVICIEYGAFENCLSLEEVIFEEGNLRRIESRAFYGCKSIERVEFPKSLEFYYEDSFNSGVKKSQRK